jgi:hypothetical protein
LKKINREKKPIRILKKPIGSVWFYEFKIKKTESNQTEHNPNWKKSSQTGKKPSLTEKLNQNEKLSQNKKNRVKLKKSSQIGFCYKITEPNRSVWTGSGSISIFLKKPVWLFFFIKTEQKKNIPSKICLKLYFFKI